MPGLSLPIATTGHLIALKLLARDDQTRPQDLADLRALLAAAAPEDLADARDAVQLISARGYDRGRDLTAALTELKGAPKGAGGERDHIGPAAHVHERQV